MSDILLLIATAHVLGKRKELPDCWSDVSMNMGYPATGHLDTDSLSFVHLQLNGEMVPKFIVGKTIIFFSSCPADLNSPPNYTNYYHIKIPWPFDLIPILLKKPFLVQRFTKPTAKRKLTYLFSEQTG
jgi:hypothetical protein